MIKMKKWLGYTMIAVAVVLSGCGGGGGGGGGGTPNATPQPSASGGTVADGYIAGATVRTQNGQNLGKTDQKGDFRIPQGIKVLPGTILTAQGGYDIATNDPFTGTLKSVYGGNGSEVVISPLTTLVAVKYQQNPGATLDAAVAEVAKALGLPKDLVTADPVKNRDAFTATQALMSTAELLGSLGGGLDVGRALDVLGRSVENGNLDLTKALQSVHAPVDLADDLKSVFEKTKEKIKDLLNQRLPPVAIQGTLKSLVKSELADRNIADLLAKLDNLQALTILAMTVKCINQNETIMLGDNIDFRYVESNLHLGDIKNRCEKNGVSIVWSDVSGPVDSSGVVVQEEEKVANAELKATLTYSGLSIDLRYPIRILPKDHFPLRYVSLKAAQIADKWFKLTGYGRSLLLENTQEGLLGGDLPGADYKFSLIKVKWRIGKRGYLWLRDTGNRSLGVLMFEKAPDTGVGGRWIHSDGKIEHISIEAIKNIYKNKLKQSKSITFTFFSFQPIGMSVGLALNEDRKKKCWISYKIPQSKQLAEGKCDWDIVNNILKISKDDISFDINFSKSATSEGIMKSGGFVEIGLNINNRNIKIPNIITKINKIDIHIIYAQNNAQLIQANNSNDINGSVLHSFMTTLVFKKSGSFVLTKLTKNRISFENIALKWSISNEDNKTILLKDNQNDDVGEIKFYNKNKLGVGSSGYIKINNDIYPIVVTDYYKIKSATTAPDVSSVTDRIYKLLDSNEDTVVLRNLGDNYYYVTYSRDDQTGDWEMEKGVWEYEAGELRLYDFNNEERETVHLYGTPDRGVAVEYHDLIDNETDRVLIDTVIPLR